VAVEREFVWNGLKHENAICEGGVETDREETDENDFGSSCLVQFRRKNSARIW